MVIFSLHWLYGRLIVNTTLKMMNENPLPKELAPE
jgi:hypothetical protein